MPKTKTPSESVIDSIFSKEGLLSKYQEDYEERPGQLGMARQVLDAYEKNKIALIEAGTGIGKTLAYLVPAVFWALKHQEKTIISTYTISLQEQLINKDIPFLLELLDVDLKAVLVKGFGNYLCLQKLNESVPDTPKENEELEKLQRWSEKTKAGSRSEIPFSVSGGAWSKVAADASKCNNVQCPYYKRCFFFKARREMEDAQILVVNHHLLFADISAKMHKDYKEEKSILPKVERVIIDEAHHMEQIALESLSKRCSQSSLIHLIEQFSKEGKNTSLAEVGASLRSRLEIEIPLEQNGLVIAVHKAFDFLYAFLRPLLRGEGEEKKILLEEKILEKDVWKKEVSDHFQDLMLKLTGFSSRLFCLKSDLSKLEIETEEIVTLLQGICQRLDEQIDILTLFFQETQDKKSRVRWIEVSLFQKKGITLVEADLDVAAYLNTYFFQRVNSASLCSATLTTGKDFTYLKGRLGLVNNTNVSENIYASPFDYQNQTLLLVPTDLPLPSEPDFNGAAAVAIIQAIKASKGNAFILFTSYEMLKICYEKASISLENEGYNLLKQGDIPRNQLLDAFKSQERSVLFGTDSFWEGVDVAGEKLRCVVIVKLPFKAPDDPLTLANSNYLTSQDKDPFFDYAVPLATIKFKQGFGRLMRKKTDRGCILCLDKRLVTKAYGKMFLKSLPPCQTFFDKSESVIEKMVQFYK